MRRNIRTAVLVMGMVAIGACGKKQPEMQPQPSAPPPAQPQPSQPTAPMADRDAAEREAEARRLAAILEQIVHFDYDEATIRTDAQELLAAKVPVLRSNTAIRIRVEGHADERGSVEYNLALGMRRANAVRDYLTGFGIDASRIETTSFGEDLPMAQGSTESAWSLNRRAEFSVTAGLIR
jgi:peptidoglycan-associated lipoprotein